MTKPKVLCIVSKKKINSENAVLLKKDEADNPFKKDVHLSEKYYEQLVKLMDKKEC